jgi:hypothetical protein
MPKKEVNSQLCKAMNRIEGTSWYAYNYVLQFWRKLKQMQRRVTFTKYLTNCAYQESRKTLFSINFTSKPVQYDMC